MSFINIFHKIRPLSGCPLLKLVQIKHIGLLSTAVDPTKPPKKPKTLPIPKITLISSGQVSIATLEEATKIAQRRNLKLVKVIDLDTKSQRPVYKLMTGTEYHEEDLKRREEQKLQKQNSNAMKGEKITIISSKIGDHDLDVQINRIVKWITKRYEVRVTINGDSTNMEKAEASYKKIEIHVKDIGRILQKRQKGNDIKFQVHPLKTKSESEIKTS